MAAILIMVVSLAIILGLLLVLLVEFFCSLLHRRQRQRSKTPINFATTSATQLSSSPQYCQRSQRTTNFTTEPTSQPPPPSSSEQSISPTRTTLSSFYAQGVLFHAPRNYLFPTISTNKDHHHNFDDLEIVHENIPYPKLVHEVPPLLQCSTSSSTTTTVEEQFVYISNPIYDHNEEIAFVTPFETPNSSPSCFEIIDNSSEEEENCGITSVSSTPSSVLLTPMKKLPAEACSISLIRSESNNSNINSSSSSSSSGSPCTSPSW
ncbi:hypothetical protein HAX54_042470 [Datura stramonium]|uniref:Uncharacterized protein n=1 Tax=Datura stramonium TaxID=4076 RepID=A0ABS8SMK9_DATST|nr:hypothetical protein [Datura stramonium]